MWGHDGRGYAVFPVMSQVLKKVLMAEIVIKDHSLLFLGTELDYISHISLQAGMAI